MCDQIGVDILQRATENMGYTFARVEKLLQENALHRSSSEN